MKKTLFILCALLLTAVGASAKVDYSSKMNNTDGTAWAHGGNTYSTGVERYSSEAYGAGRVLYQTISGLPAGNYEVEFYAVANMAWISAAYGSNIAQVFANEAVQDIDVIANNDADKLKETMYTLSCTVGVDGILDYGLQNIATGGNWYVCEGVSLILTEASDATLQEGATLHGEDEEVDDIGHWSQTFTNSSSTYGGLDYNTWSGENGMTVPYHQVWVWTGDASALSDQTISHAQFTGLPAGYYTVSVDARVLSEVDSAIGEGSAYFYANDDKVDIVANASTDEDFEYGDSAAQEHEESGWYSLVVQVTDDGTLDIGFTIQNATYNWLSWKNLKVVYDGPTAPTEVHECEADIDHWTITDHSTGVFQRNTWSTEEDESGMVTPFLEYWVWVNTGEGTEATLPSATISHKTLTDLEPGTYEVSMDIRIMNDNEDIDPQIVIGEGTLFKANDASEDILTGSDAKDGTYNGHEDVYGTYTLIATVGAAGTLDISLFIPEGVTYDWIAFKNLKVTLIELAEDPYVYDVTKLLANPSFEEDNVANLTADSNRGYAVTSLVGWTLDGPNGDNAHKDIMTASSTETDANYGIPGSPSDGTQMLYLRDAWGENTGSVMQTVTLPAGEYKLTVDSKCAAGVPSYHSAKLVVNDESTALTIHAKGTPTSDTAKEQFVDGWDTAVLEFSLDEETEVQLGVQLTFGAYQYGLAAILDNFQLFSTQDIVVWDMTDAMWGTLILPFGATLPDGLTAYSTGEVTPDDEDSDYTLSLNNEGASISANTPYIIGADEESAVGTYYFTGEDADATDNLTSGKLTGTYETMDYTALAAVETSTSSTVYLLQNHTDGDGVAFYPVVENASKDATLTPYHCYLTLTESDLKTTSAPAKLSFSFGGEATAIEAVEGDEAEGNGAIYDLSGRKVSKAVKGVYIQNGKKVLVK